MILEVSFSFNPP